ncbi:hypothetical protein ACFYOF_20695 [Streptomyces sp. NPDC007148]|uniref:hypothetical protein n=1 Tax=Streptomyces sp. NPDC007148 TaxID=3364775 RepID=UPI003678D6D7
MVNESQRTVRLRLARRRAAPNRVRARVPDELPEPQIASDEEPEADQASELDHPPKWWRRVDWGKVATVAGVVGGVGSLLFSAVATYYGAKVSQDQLQQSREDSERQLRVQASEVTYWTEWPNGVRLHLVNRSPDPVTVVRLGFTTEDYHGGDSYSWVLDLPVLGPCSELIYDETKFKVYFPPASKSPKVVKWLDVGDSFGDTDMRFADSNGHVWKRTAGSLQRTPSLYARPLPHLLLPGDPEVKPVQQCAGG